MNTAQYCAALKENADALYRAARAARYLGDTAAATAFKAAARAVLNVIDALRRIS